MTASPSDGGGKTVLGVVSLLISGIAELSTAWVVINSSWLLVGNILGSDWSFVFPFPS